MKASHFRRNTGYTSFIHELNETYNVCVLCLDLYSCVNILILFNFYS